MAAADNPKMNSRNPRHPRPEEAGLQNRMEGVLPEYGQYLATILATVQVGILVIDAETHLIVDANPKAVEIIGCARDKIIGALCHKFVCPKAVGECPITDLGQAIDRSDRELCTASGGVIPIIKSVATVTLNGRPHLIESFLDISDRVRAEEALKESEQRYHDLLENANDLIQSVAPNGSFLYVNHAWKETMGYTDEEIAALKVFSIIAPSCQGHCQGLFQRVMGGELIHRVEVQFVAKDGRVIDLEGSVNCSFIDGKPVATRSIFRDITDRKRAQDVLKESEAHYRDLFDNVSDLIQKVTADGAFVYVNKAWLTTLGYGEEEIGTLSFHDIIADDCREQFMSSFGTLLRGKKHHGRIETTFKAKGGKSIPVEGTFSLEESDGELVGIRFIWRDITERKRVEAEREKWHRNLEKKVEEKTRHLREAQAKLIQSEKMTTLSEVISGAAHELNNPLAGILGAVHLLRGSTLSKPIEPALMDEIDVLESVENAALRCQRIVEDLILFSMQSHCSFTQVDINEVLRDVLEVMGDQLAEANAMISWQADPDLPSIEGDFVKLFEVFSNILQNANSSLAEEGTIEITTKVKKTYAASPQIAVTISDTGCGIPAQNLDKIFNPFFTTKPAGKGPGLGLTVSYSIVKRHHGEIEVKSVVGKGTAVTITLPLKQPKE